MSDLDDQLFRKLGEIADEVFFIYDLDANRLNYLSPAFGTLSSLSYDELAERPARLLDLVYHEDRDYLNEQLKTFARNGKIKAEFRIMRENVPVYVQLTAHRLGDTDGLVAGWLANIDTVKENILYAEKVNARKNSLLEILSHDLKEPIAIINMMASAIERDPSVSSNKTLSGYVQTIRQLCDSHIELIRSVVHKEFLEAKEVSIRMERADLVWSVQDVMKQYEGTASLTNKQFSFHSDQPKLYIVMDTLKIIQVVNNLISNAIKFTRERGRIEVQITDLGSSVRVTFSDDGIGIPAELQPFLFEPHTRAQRPGLRNEPGTGMGLFIIRSLAELHGGRIWYQSEDGKGAAFHLELPKNL